MNFPEIEILDACREVQQRNAEMLPLLASALGVSEKQVFYRWALRRCAQLGQLPGGQWRYYFHGIECDLKNSADGRHLRIDFGPEGRVDTFTAWGVLRFIMHSVTPWAEHPQLKSLFATKDRPSGDFPRFLLAWDRLQALGCFEPARPDLIALEADHTTIGPDGIRVVTWPTGTSEELQADTGVADRQILSAKGLHLLGERSVEAVECNPSIQP